jgi:hypothetical protein
VSQENINVVQSFFDALPRGDIGAAAASLDPQAVITEHVIAVLSKQVAQ